MLCGAKTSITLQTGASKLVAYIKIMPRDKVNIERRRTIIGVVSN